MHVAQHQGKVGSFCRYVASSDDWEQGRKIKGENIIVEETGPKKGQVHPKLVFDVSGSPLRPYTELGTRNCFLLLNWT